MKREDAERLAAAGLAAPPQSSLFVPSHVADELEAAEEEPELDRETGRRIRFVAPGKDRTLAHQPSPARAARRRMRRRQATASRRRNRR